MNMGAYSDGVTDYAPTDMEINYAKVSSTAITASFTPPTFLTNTADTIYLNTFEGANGSTPSANTP